MRMIRVVLTSAVIAATVSLASQLGSDAQPSVGKPRASVKLISPNGTTVLEADEYSWDSATLRYDAKGRVEVTSPKGFVSADTMVLYETAQGQADWAKADGHVVVRQKQESGAEVTGTGNHGEYYEIKQKANLSGDVVLKYSASNLLEPAVLTGARGDMDLATQKSVVIRTPEAQARLVVKPKGKSPGTPPEPITLLADRIESDGKLSTHVATGSPKMLRGTYTMKADLIRFHIDSMTNDLKEAVAEKNVVLDGTMTNGSVVHATGDHAVYDQAKTLMIVTGSVKGRQTLPNNVERQFTTWKFWYNPTTKSWGTGAPP